jgi:hypothetical protein
MFMRVQLYEPTLDMTFWSHCCLQEGVQGCHIISLDALATATDKTGASLSRRYTVVDKRGYSQSRGITHVAVELCFE